ncbi:MAG: hypothetical protein R3D26_10660 [Cyanobacteriota/Melainabacteria group bacterium]
MRTLKLPGSSCLSVSSISALPVRASACLVAIALILLAVAVNPVCAAGASGKTYVKSYKGTISKYKISMTLSLAGEKVTGTYSYDHVGKPIKLKGEWMPAGLFSLPGDNCTISEFDASGKSTGKFEGALTDYEFFGNWKAGKKSLPFSLVATDSRGAGSAGLIRKSHAKYKTEQHDGIVQYPVLTVTNKAVEKKLASALVFEKIHDPDLKGWLSNADYYVMYNRDNLLDVIYWADGFGAYPEAYFKTIRLSLKTGAKMPAAGIFKKERLGDLVKLVDTAMQNKIKLKLKEDVPAEDASMFKEQLNNAHFTMKAIDSFCVGGDGITFYYEFGFPHISRCYEPEGFFFFPYSQLQGYLRADGPLGHYVKGK